MGASLVLSLPVPRTDVHQGIYNPFHFCPSCVVREGEGEYHGLWCGLENIFTGGPSTQRVSKRGYVVLHSLIIPQSWA